MIICPHCSGENKESARFCRHCGSSIYETESYSSTRLPLGTILDDRYKIIDYVAKGGMGAVYKAVDLTQQGIFWAVKEMLDYFDTDDEREYAVERFATEAQILYDLNHDCIPKFVDCFVSETRYYLVMEFIDGEDLRKILDDTTAAGIQGLDEKDVINWSIQICDVLTYLHSQDPAIIYRDMKPGNLMVNKQNKVYLIDFGIARLFDPRIKGTMVGTQGYAPPEQYRGEAEPRSDLYSLAACMHHLLTGKDPRNDIPFNFPVVRSLRPELSEGIEKTLEKALAMDPKDRYKDMKDMKEHLLKLQGPVMIEDPGPITRFIEPEPVMPDISAIIPKPIPMGMVLEEQEPPAVEEEPVYESASKLSFWYMFRSDRRHSGKSPFGRNIQGRFLWSFNAESEIRSSPTLGSDGVVYFGANNGKLYAVSPEGQLKWTYQTSARIISSPSINRDGNIYVGSNDSYLYALDPEGHLLWKFKTYGRIRSSPCVGVDGTIYIGSYDHYFYAINNDGSLKWRLNLKGYLESTPALADNGDIFVASKGMHNGGSLLYCVNTDGKIRWFSNIGSPVKSSPCVSRDGYIYIGGMDGSLYAFTPKGTLTWKFQTSGPIISSPLADNGSAIMICSFDRRIYCVSPDGKKIWDYSTFSSIASSPAMAGNGSIFVGGDDNFIYAVSQDGQSIWRIKCGGRVRSSPAIGENDILYVGSDDGFLYAIE